MLYCVALHHKVTHYIRAKELIVLIVILMAAGY